MTNDLGVKEAIAQNRRSIIKIEERLASIEQKLSNHARFLTVLESSNESLNNQLQEFQSTVKASMAELFSQVEAAGETLEDIQQRLEEADIEYSMEVNAVENYHGEEEEVSGETPEEVEEPFYGALEGALEELPLPGGLDEDATEVQ